MLKLTSLDFYNILTRIARYMPAKYDEFQREKTCERLQTFAVVRSSEVFNTLGSLEKTALYVEKDIFFSRPWEEGGRQPSAIAYAYPALLIWEVNNVYTDFFKSKASKNTVTYCFALMDKMPDGDTSNACGAKTFEEKDYTLKTMQTSILKTLQNFWYVRATLANVFVFEGWYHKAELDSYITNGIIDNYRTESEFGDFISSKSLEVNSVFDEFADKLMGGFTTIDIELAQCVAPIELDIHSIPDPIADSFKPCCE